MGRDWSLGLRNLWERRQAGHRPFGRIDLLLLHVKLPGERRVRNRCGAVGSDGRFGRISCLQQLTP